jgi:hypothetical protein
VYKCHLHFTDLMSFITVSTLDILTDKLCYLQDLGGPYAGLLGITRTFPAGKMQKNYFCHIPV